MPITRELLERLDLALNEATLRDVHVHPARCLATVVLDMLSPSGNETHDMRVTLRLHGVGRVAASLRMGAWDDPVALVRPFDLADLPVVVHSFGGQPVYGAKFFDVSDEGDPSRWPERLSLDTWLDHHATVHTMTIFQEGDGPRRHLDVRIWFDELTAIGPDGAEIALEEMAAAGERWWAGFLIGEVHADEYGLFPIPDEDA